MAMPNIGKVALFMQRVCLSKRGWLLLGLVGIARLAWALSDLLDLPPQKGCIGDSTFIIAGNVLEDNQKRICTIKYPLPQECLKVGMTEADVQSALSKDVYCSGYRAVSASERKSILRSIKAYLPTVPDDEILVQVYRDVTSKDDKSSKSSLLVVYFRKDAGLMDAFWVYRRIGSPQVSAFGGGAFEDRFRTIGVGETLDSVSEKLGERLPDSYEQDALGVWCVRYGYDIAGWPATIWIDGATATVRKTAFLCGYRNPKEHRVNEKEQNVHTISEIVDHVCKLLERGSVVHENDSHAKTVEALLQAKQYLRLQLMKCSDNEEVTTLCKRYVQVMQRLIDLSTKGRQGSCVEELQRALLNEELERFQCEYANWLFSYFSDDTVDVAPYLLEHQYAAERCVRLAMQAYNKGLISQTRLCDILLLLERPLVRSR